MPKAIGGTAGRLVGLTMRSLATYIVISCALIGRDKRSDDRLDRDLMGFISFDTEGRSRSTHLFGSDGLSDGTMFQIAWALDSGLSF